jgi:spermidine synthase
VRNLALYLTVLVISTCGLVYELVAGAAATYLLGDQVTQFATVVGVHLTCMGIGAWATHGVDRDVARRFVDCQLAAALVGGASVPMMFLAFAHTAWVRPVIYLCVALTGALVGAEVPLFLRVLRRRVSFADLLARALSVDYMGALLGSLAFALVVLPRLGLVRAGLAFGALNALTALYSAQLLASSIDDLGPLRRRAYAVLALLALGVALAPALTKRVDEEVSLDPVIFVRQTRYQRVVVTRGHGGMNLFLDGNLQFAQTDEHRYHEALVHPALTTARRRDRVLVLGGGDGLAVREILRYPDVAKVTLVELDPEMIALARDTHWLRELNRGSLRSPRVEVIFDDAMVWLDRTASRAEKFDAAIVDFPDPNNFALGKLYTARFYRLLRARLRDDAVVAVQSTSPLVARRSYWCIVRTMEHAGFRVRPYHALVPSFGEWGYALATPTEMGAPGPLPMGLRYLNEATMQAMFAFSPDTAPVDVEINRLNNQALVRYYEDEWRRATR